MQHWRGKNIQEMIANIWQLKAPIKVWVFYYRLHFALPGKLNFAYCFELYSFTLQCNHPVYKAAVLIG